MGVLELPGEVKIVSEKTSKILRPRKRPCKAILRGVFQKRVFVRLRIKRRLEGKDGAILGILGEIEGFKVGI